MKCGDIPRDEFAQLIESALADARALEAANQTRIRSSGLSARAQRVVDECLGVYARAGGMTALMLAALGDERTYAARLLYELAAANIRNIEAATARACEPYLAKERS